MKVIKRNGEQVPFESEKIFNVIVKAMRETEIGVDLLMAGNIAEEIYRLAKDKSEPMNIEEIQDLVEELLMKKGRYEVAKRYILYREERNQLRGTDKYSKYKFLSDNFLSRYKHRQDPFPTELGKFVYYRTYARPIPEQNRRERWWETVARVVDFNIGLELTALKKRGIVISELEMDRLKNEAMETYDNIYNLKLFPSGRTLWVGGTTPSYEYPLSNFNCSFVTIDELKKFSEIFFVLMLGTGVGLSVERKYISKLPRINTKIGVIHKDYQAKSPSDRSEFTELKLMNDNIVEIVIGDSKFGWSKAIEIYFDIISSKQYSDIEYILLNYDNVRGKGERLKTFGGYASGHTAIKTMFDKISNIFQEKRRLNNSQWQFIEPIDALDIATIIAENVVSGGTRRSAEIIFCDNDDLDVINAKQNIYYQDIDGSWKSNDKLLHRMLSNNTVFYNEKPTREQLRRQFELIRLSGEPSFGNMQEMKRRRSDVQGGNPCFEILLRDRGVCNLTEINLMGFVNDDGTYNLDEMLKVQGHSAKMGYRMATIELELHEWDLVNKEDMLVGCSLTGVMDFKNATQISEGEFIELLRKLREVAHYEVKQLSKKLGLNESKLITTIKPSGTISQLPTVSSGVHFSHSPYYIRRVRVSANDPLALAMDKNGFSWSPEVGQTIDNHDTKVFEFPVKAPNGRTKYDVSAIEQLELYKLIMENYVDHNASNTIHVKNDEWEDVENWVYDNWDSIVGVTFLSLDDSFYQLMPYESITKEKYEELLSKTPKFNPRMLMGFENFEDEFDVLDSDCESGVCPIR